MMGLLCFMLGGHKFSQADKYGAFCQYCGARPSGSKGRRNA